ncbi:MAG: UDP-N-acetylmuramoyl-L-alanine--D-glutamate ligase [Gemmatimonadota bacterium]|nr:MAG: UDP-N-acetylmuramoyl-L-alanine--D-glutamate ligase [Gemmatimonadota bacterium]
MKIPASWSELRIGVLGLGRSGRAATRLLAEAGASVYASDVADTDELRAEAEALRGPRVEVELGRHDARALEGCDLIVASPGIPPGAEVFQAAGVRSRPIISELELAFSFLDAPVIAVTGTNGKTTTTAWIAAMLERAGIKVGVGGNIGRALSEIAIDSDAGYEWVVAEVSSFQLADIDRFKPAIGVFLNLCPDHLDWHVDIEDYYAAKARLFDNADSDSRWVLNGEDDGVLRLAARQPGSAWYFRVASPLAAGEQGAFIAENDVLTARYGGAEVELVARSDLKLLGTHNVANALASVLAAALAQVPLAALREGLREFEPLPHRLQPVTEKDGVLWVNDSKATNVASTRVALQAMDRPVVLLLGGRPKGESFAALLPDLRERVRAVVAYGEAAAQIESELGGEIALVREDGSFEDVVRRARDLAKPGDSALLAPACASFDMFRNYEERGERFMALLGREPS